MGFELYIKHKITWEISKPMMQEISEYAPLVGLKLGEKNELFYCSPKYDVKQANCDKIKLKFENSKGFNFYFSFYFFKMF